MASQLLTQQDLLAWLASSATTAELRHFGAAAVRQQRTAAHNQQDYEENQGCASFSEFLSLHARRKATAQIDLRQLVASAEAISAAVDALPVGRDIRQRLQARIASHIEQLRAFEPRP